jgi:hypothetical protein
MATPENVEAPLFGVTVVGASDAWAVGTIGAGVPSAKIFGYVLHWTGQRWSADNLGLPHRTLGRVALDANGALQADGSVVSATAQRPAAISWQPNADTATTTLLPTYPLPSVAASVRI